MSSLLVSRHLRSHTHAYTFLRHGYLRRVWQRKRAAGPGTGKIGPAPRSLPQRGLQCFVCLCTPRLGQQPGSSYLYQKLAICGSDGWIAIWQRQRWMDGHCSDGLVALWQRWMAEQGMTCCVRSPCMYVTSLYKCADTYVYTY